MDEKRKKINKEFKLSFFWRPRSEEHTSELQSQSTISYAVFCLKKKKKKHKRKITEKQQRDVR